jgi:YD repeat-containing protein
MKSVLTLITVCCILSAQAQFQQAQLSVSSPNATNFTIYGTYPVSNFSGVPSINLPLFNVQEGPISMPVSLSYHSGSITPEIHPGWTGLGWSLESCGGAITRVQHGFADEQKMSNGTAIGYYYNYNYLNDPNWNTEAKLYNYASWVNTLNTPTNNFIDVMPDEFHFNFLQYSGTFMMGHDGQWKVSCSDKVKIVLDPTEGIVDVTQLRTELKTKISFNSKSNANYFFNKFLVTTPDGTTYEFGGVNATEYNTYYRNQATAPLVATAWHLTKIKTQDGKSITLSYEPGDKICTMSHGYGYSKTSDKGNTSWVTLLGPCGVVAPSLQRTLGDGFLIWPVYLKTVTTSLSTISFIRSQSNELRYRYVDTGDGSQFGYNIDPTFFWYFDGPKKPDPTDATLEMQWAKLDTIKILDQYGFLFKAFSFGYNSSQFERLKLLSLQTITPKIAVEDDEGSRIVPFDTKLVSETYNFKYNSKTLPDYGSDRIDHWGYYNSYIEGSLSATTIDQWISAYNIARQPDQTGDFLRAEILERIDYPTGGYTTFGFEPHRYSSAVDKDRTAPLVSYPTDQYAGGTRIRTISSYDRDGSLLLTKEYYYVKSYQGQSDISSLRSSGVLGGQIQYYWPGYGGKDLAGTTFTYDLLSSNSLLPSCYNAQGSHIGYSEVVERQVGNGYTKYIYSNFDADIFGVKHQDKGPAGVIDGKRSTYSPVSKKDMERGVLQMVQDYDNANNLVKSIKSHYDASDSNYVRCIETQYLSICRGMDNAQRQTYFGTAFKKYIYSYNKTSEEVTIYDTDKSGSATSLKTFHYNTNNLVDRVTEINSNGVEYRTETQYPPDIAKGTFSFDSAAYAVDYMASKTIYMINVPIEVTKYINGKVYDSQITKYFVHSKGAFPFAEYRTQLSIPALNYTKAYRASSDVNDGLILDPTCKRTNRYTYDDFGSIKEVIGENGITTTYLWSYSHLFLIAKIENATYQQVQNTVGATALTNLESDPYQVNQTLLPLRTSTSLPNTLVTSYLYSPLQGVTSITDANNFSTYYSYDEYRRLKYIKDADGNILKMFEYNYLLK